MWSCSVRELTAKSLYPNCPQQACWASSVESSETPLPPVTAAGSFKGVCIKRSAMAGRPALQSEACLPVQVLPWY